MKPEQINWVKTWELSGQCNQCAHLVLEHRLASCEHHAKGFPAAFYCPLFRQDEEEND